MNIKKIISIIVIVVVLILISITLLFSTGDNEKEEGVTLNNDPFGNFADDANISRGSNSDSVSVNSPYFYSNNPDTGGSSVDSSSDTSYSNTQNDTHYYEDTTGLNYNYNEHDYSYNDNNTVQYYITNDYDNYSISDNNGSTDNSYDNLFSDEDIGNLIAEINAGDYDYDDDYIENYDYGGYEKEVNECDIVRLISQVFGVSKSKAKIIVALNPMLFTQCLVQQGITNAFN